MNNRTTSAPMKIGPLVAVPAVVYVVPLRRNLGGLPSQVFLQKIWEGEKRFRLDDICAQNI